MNTKMTTQIRVIEKTPMKMEVEGGLHQAWGIIAEDDTGMTGARFLLIGDDLGVEVDSLVTVTLELGGQEVEKSWLREAIEKLDSNDPAV